MSSDDRSIAWTGDATLLGEVDRDVSQQPVEGAAESLSLITSPSVPPPIPLAGDLVAQLAARLGADRAAAWIAAKLGVDCGCPERQRRLNELDGKIRRWLRCNP